MQSRDTSAQKLFSVDPLNVGAAQELLNIVQLSLRILSQDLDSWMLRDFIIFLIARGGLGRNNAVTSHLCTKQDLC